MAEERFFVEALFTKTCLSILLKANVSMEVSGGGNKGFSDIILSISKITILIHTIWLKTLIFITQNLVMKNVNGGLL